MNDKTIKSGLMNFDSISIYKNNIMGYKKNITGIVHGDIIIKEKILEKVYFHGCFFIDVEFFEMNIANVIFDACVLDNVTFTKCEIQDVVFTKTRMKNVYFDSATKVKNVDVTSIIPGDNPILREETNATEFVRSKGASACPETGAFEAWKVVAVYGYTKTGKPIYCPILAKLQIPEDASRSSGFSNKCRASKAICLGFYNFNGTEIKDMTEYGFLSYNIQSFFRTTDSIYYSIGRVVEAECFDPRWWIECSGGIHFFMKIEECIDYLESCGWKIEKLYLKKEANDGK